MRTLDPHTLYSEAPFFLDFIAGHREAVACFPSLLPDAQTVATRRWEREPVSVHEVIVDALREYNHALGASQRAMDGIDALGQPRTLCVIGGQQAGFLGGPLFVLFKIASVLNAASQLSESLAVPVVPIFWLATEDHDLDEISWLRWVDNSGTLRTIRFDWEEKGRPIEAMPRTDEVQAAYTEAMERIRFRRLEDAEIFAPHASDGYGAWHARIWSRLFSRHGLVLLEPRLLRSHAGEFYERARRSRPELQEMLHGQAQHLQTQGYTAALDPTRAGTLFTITPGGARTRLDATVAEHHTIDPATLSADVALRPLLADHLLPTVASVLGPSELAYHAMLRPIYTRWNIPQPCPVPRRGGTVLSCEDDRVLRHAALSVETVIDPKFQPSAWAQASASPDLTQAFDRAKEQLKTTLQPLRQQLVSLDPSLELRWRQALDQSLHPLDRLLERAVRVELSRIGVSVKSLHRIQEELRPAGDLQERTVSAFSVIATHGVEWVDRMIADGDPGRFTHELLVLGEDHE
jgi:bacillithiol synthase